MATARVLPSGSWRVRMFVGIENGKKVYKSFTAPTKAEAELMATQYVIDKEQKKKMKSANLFCDELSKYITTKEAVLSPSTIKGYKNMERMLKKDYNAFYNMKIADIEQEHVQEVISSLSKPKSPKTVRKIWNC